MALFSGFFGARQAELHAPLSTNDLTDTSSWPALAASINPLPVLADHRPAPTTQRKRSASTKTALSVVESTDKPVQLNVRVKASMLAQLRAVAQRKGVSLTALVASYCAAGLKRERS